MNQKNNTPSFKVFGNFDNKPGSVPGDIKNYEHKASGPVTIQIFDYDDEHIDFIAVDSIEECKPYLQKSTKTWINVQGLGEIKKLKSICSYFNLHPLVQEDIMNTGQRPKLEQYKNYLFIVMRLLSYDREQESIMSKQISIVLGENYLLSFQEKDAPVFKPVIDRINNSAGLIRTSGIDYLAYALLDNITDYYFSLLNEFNDQLEHIEEGLIDQPDKDIFQKIHTVRKNIVFTRKSLWPARDMLTALSRDNSGLIGDTTKIYLRDVYDHIVQTIYNLDSLHDMSIGMYDLYMSDVNNQMNEVMKVLTIIATIFIPLTFIAGVYGMNFNPEKSPWNLPELSWYYGYPACLAVMAAIAIIMLIYFRRKGWI